VVADVQLSGLGPAERLTDGGQGTVFRLPTHPGFLLKHYHDGVGVDAAELGRLIDLPRQLSAGDQRLVRIAMAWPRCRVFDGDRLVGFVMPQAPGWFHTLIGGRSRPLELQFLLYPRRAMWPDLPLPDLGQRAALAGRMVALFDVLHRNGLVVGDVSMKNFLWTISGPPAVFAVDCDGFQVVGRGPAVQPAETEGWQDPAGSGTLDSDRYKLALLVLRMLLVDHGATPDMAVHDRLLGPDIVALAERARTPGTRPDAGTWRRALSRPHRVDPAPRTPAPRRAADEISRPLLRLDSPPETYCVSTPVTQRETSSVYD
jgi:DNA-binding helix-hairpin-helix protein with protein kinase domain